MRTPAVALAIFSTFVFAQTATSDNRKYDDFDCMENCSGHAAGYAWAEQHDVVDEADCPLGNSQSFREGCLAFVRDPARGEEEDDNGNMLEEPTKPRFSAPITTIRNAASQVGSRRFPGPSKKRKPASS
jgi:hypothetical protein